MHILRPGGSQGVLLDRFKVALGHPRPPQGLPVLLRGAPKPPPEVENDPTWRQKFTKKRQLGIKNHSFSINQMQFFICTSIHVRLPLHIHISHRVIMHGI